MRSRETDANVMAALKAMAERQDAAEREVSALRQTVKDLETRLAEASGLRGTDKQAPGSELTAAEAEVAAGEKSDAIAGETMAVIAAAATAFAGENVRLRSVSMLPAAQEAVSAWSQQGRAVVQTSHNLRSR